MDRSKLNDILKETTLVGYTDGYQYCRKIIMLLMSMAKPEHRLVPREVEVLSVMCKMCVDGKSDKAFHGPSVVKAMEECGVDPLQVDSIRNSRYFLKQKKWITKDTLSLRMMKAISDGGLTVGVLLNKTG